MRSRLVLLILVLLVAVTAAAWTLLRPFDQGGGAGAGAAARSASEPSRPFPAANLDSLKPESSSTVSRIAPTTSQPACTIELIIVDDPDGERPPTTTSFVLVRWNIPDPRQERVEAPGGLWSSTFETGERWDIEDLCVDGNLARVGDQAGRSIDPGSGSHRMRVHLAAQSVVRFLDEAQKRECQGVEIRYATDPSTLAFGHPPPTSALMTASTASPLHLVPKCDDPWRDARTFWARAPGFGWKRFDLYLRTGSHEVVTLTGAGNLELHISGLVPTLSNTLRISSLEWHLQPTIERADITNGVHSIEQLSEGGYRVTIEARGKWPEPVLLASTQFSLHTSARARVDLHAVDASALTIAPLSGTITIDPAWNVVVPSITVSTPMSPRSHFLARKVVETIDPDPEHPDTWKWDAGFVDVGWIIIDVPEPRFTAFVELTERGKSDVSIVLGPPVEVSIALEDVTTGQPSGLRGLHWGRPVPEGVLGSGMQPTHRSESTGMFTIRTSPGPLAISVRHEDYEPADFEILAQAPQSVHTLRVRRATVVHLVFKRERRELLFAQPTIGVTPVGHTGRTPSVEHGEGKVSLRFETGGRYRITIDEIAGFEPVTPFEIQVEPYARQVREVPLVLKR